MKKLTKTQDKSKLKDKSTGNTSRTNFLKKL